MTYIYIYIERERDIDSFAAHGPSTFGGRDSTQPPRREPHL